MVSIMLCGSLQQFRGAGWGRQCHSKQQWWTGLCTLANMSDYEVCEGFMSIKWHLRGHTSMFSGGDFEQTSEILTKMDLFNQVTKWLPHCRKHLISSCHEVIIIATGGAVSSRRAVLGPTLRCWVPNREAIGTIFKVFGMKEALRQPAANHDTP